MTALVSASRIQVRRHRYLIPFLWRSWRISREMRRAAGFLGGLVHREPGGVFWTCTLWTDYASMDRFRNRGQHLAAMRQALGLTEELVHGHWEQTDREFPALGVLHERLARNARFTKLVHATSVQRGHGVAGFVDEAAVRTIHVAPKRPLPDDR